MSGIPELASSPIAREAETDAIGSLRRDGRFEMPAAMKQEFRLPLWSFLFELINGRLFKNAIEDWYALVVPLASALEVLIALVLYGDRITSITMAPVSQPSAGCASDWRLHYAMCLWLDHRPLTLRSGLLSGPA